MPQRHEDHEGAQRLELKDGFVFVSFVFLVVKRYSENAQIRGFTNYVVWNY